MSEDEPDSGSDSQAETAVRRDRFSGGPAREFLSSLDADERIFHADLAVDRAHVVMCAERGIIDEATAGEILRALDDVESAGHGDLPDGEDVQEAIESAVIDRVGAEGGAESDDSAARQATKSSDGGKMHTARSRNDEVAADIRYRLRGDLLDTIETVVEAREELLAVAEDHVDTVMPGYTHLQPAQPTTVGHWVASYEQALQRDTERLLDAYDRVNRNPLGAGAFSGVPYDIDREHTAELLGFEGVVENSMDAVSARDFLVESNAALANLATTLSGMAEDVVVFASRGHVELADEYASTSSIMPQKKNPDTMELVRGRTGDATAGLNGLLAALKGLPRAYNRDLQRATTHVWDSLDAVTESVEVATGAVATATWPEDVLAEAAGEGFSTATGVADLLAKAGMPFRTAHEVVATAAGQDFEGRAPTYEDLDAVARDVLGESLDAHVSRGAVEEALDPVESVAMRDSRGGPAADAVGAQLSTAGQALAGHREVLATERDAVESAEKTLRTEVESYV